MPRMMAALFAQQIAVLFLMMGAGALLVVLGLARSEDSRVLSIATIYLISPCVILKAFQIGYSPGVRDGFLLALAAAVVVHILFFAFAWVLDRMLRLDAVEKASIIYPNCGNLTIPLVMAVLGDEWVVYASAYMCVQLVFMFTHGQSLMEGRTAFDWKAIVTNVNLVAIAVGISLFALDVRLPDIPLGAVDGLANCIGPVSMVMLGMVMAGVDWKRMLANPRLYLVAGIRMIALPLAVVALFKFSGLAALVPQGRDILLVSLLGAAGPSAAMVTQLAQLFGRDAGYASCINAVTTLSCLAFMPLMVWLYLL